MHLVHVNIHLASARALLATCPTPMRTTWTSHMITPVCLLREDFALLGTLSRGPPASFNDPLKYETAALRSPCSPRQVVLRARERDRHCLHPSTPPPLQSFWCSSRTLSIHQALGFVALPAPCMVPETPFFVGVFQIAPNMYARPVRCQSTCGRWTATKWTEEGGSVYDCAGNIEIIPASEVAFADELMTSAPTACW